MRRLSFAHCAAAALSKSTTAAICVAPVNRAPRECDETGAFRQSAERVLTCHFNGSVYAPSLAFPP
jgi:hypothetical protein